MVQCKVEWEESLYDNPNCISSLRPTYHAAWIFSMHGDYGSSSEVLRLCFVMLGDFDCQPAMPLHADDIYKQCI